MITKMDVIDIINSKLSSSLLFLDEEGEITTHVKEGSKPIASIHLTSMDIHQDNINFTDMNGSKKEIKAKETITFYAEIMALDCGAIIPKNKKEVALPLEETLPLEDNKTKIRTPHSEFLFLDLEKI